MDISCNPLCYKTVSPDSSHCVGLALIHHLDSQHWERTGDSHSSRKLPQVPCATGTSTSWETSSETIENSWFHRWGKIAYLNNWIVYNWIEIENRWFHVSSGMIKDDKIHEPEGIYFRAHPLVGDWALNKSKSTLHTPQSALHTPPPPTLYTPICTPDFMLLQPTVYTVYFTLHIYSTLYTSYSTLHTSRPTLCTTHSALQSLYCTLYTPNFRFYTSSSTLHTLSTAHSTLNTLHTPPFPL